MNAEVSSKKEILMRVQDIEYNALIELDKICMRNGIKYYLRGGSVLGAVKYHDFVPWDDDIDIALPRDDYRKLIEIIPDKFGDKFQFVSFQRTKDAHCYFPRIILGLDECRKFGVPKNNERGLVLIDVLPIDGMPDNKFVLNWHIYKSIFFRALASLWTLDVKSTICNRKGIKQSILNTLHALQIYKLYKQDVIFAYLDKMYSKYIFGETKYSGTMASSKLKKEIVKSEWYGSGTKMNFRELSVMVPQNYDLYLKQLFGDDYASYEPSERERVKSHIFSMR